MSALDPQAPSQPSLQTGYDTKGNPAQQTQEEQNKADKPNEGPQVDQREQHDVPSQHGEEATASSLGYGDTGPLKEKDISKSDAAHNYTTGNSDLEGEQMRAPGEGEVAKVVEQGGHGGHKGEESLTANMDDKMQAHKEELHRRGERTGAEIEKEGSEDWTGKSADVGEALSGRGTKIVLAAE